MMPCQILIHATTHDEYEKGASQDVRDSAGGVAIPPWGSAEGLPDYVVLELTDATAAGVQPYLDAITNALTWELLNQNAEGRRYEIRVNSKIASDFPEKSIRQEMRDVLENDWGATLVNWNLQQGWARFDIPNTDWQALRDDMLDKFLEQVEARRFVFDPADVDIVIGQGGFYSTVKTAVLARVVDRYAE